jgi:hypothetical protein
MGKILECPICFYADMTKDQLVEHLDDNHGLGEIIGALADLTDRLTYE